MSEAILSPKACPKTANSQLANYLSKRLFKSPNGNFLVCFPSAFLQEVTFSTFKQFLEPERAQKSPEEFGQAVVKEVLNLFYQYSGVRERIHIAENGCLYLGVDQAERDMETAALFEIQDSFKTDYSAFNSVLNLEDDEEVSH